MHADAKLYVDVLLNIHQKGTKNALETGRTFATLFADMDLRLRLLGARSEDEFKQLMWEHMKELADEQCDGNARRKLSDDSAADKIDEPPLTSTVSPYVKTRNNNYNNHKFFSHIALIYNPLGINYQGR